MEVSGASMSFFEYWFSDSYTLLRGIKEFLCVLAVFSTDLDGV